MKFDLDCVRDILLTIESMEYGKEIKIVDLVKALPKYSEEDLNYNCLKLLEAGFINCLTTQYLDPPGIILVCIKDITYKGHEFLGSIRDNTVWKKTKSIAGRFGQITLHMIGSIAKEIILATIGESIQ